MNKLISGNDNRRWIWVIGGIAIGLLAGIFFRSTSPQAASDPETTATAPVEADLQQEDNQTEQYTYAAPTFSLPDDMGEMVNLESFYGQPVLINFWASWCPPCRQEMAIFEDRYRQYSEDGLVILAVNTDDSEEVIREFKEVNQLSFHLLQDYQNQVIQQYAVTALPTSFFIDTEGNIVSRHVGLLTDDLMDDYLSKLGIEP
ncbi:MAG: TlpA family protein disulfide reductase [Anaerolineales bacterium]|nr:TlpA family protein disulfide reductase [Anaerolineales bacterium]